jgi:hypothetical protein
MDTESVVIYTADGRERLVRGLLIEQTEWGIKLKRRDGLIQLAWAAIIKIETPDGEPDAC